MSKRHTPVLVLAVVLAVVAVVGYVLPDDAPALPQRILFDNAGGRVVFDHGAHMREYQLRCEACHHATGEKDWGHETHIQDYGLDCQSCHHGPDIEPEPGACSMCHEKTGDEAVPSLRDAVHARCMSCHEEAFAEKDAGCAMCHSFEVTKEAFLKKTMPEKAAECSACHNAALAEANGGAMDAFHASCMGCHVRLEKGPYGEERCSQCHTVR